MAAVALSLRDACGKVRARARAHRDLRAPGRPCHRQDVQLLPAAADHPSKRTFAVISPETLAAAPSVARHGSRMAMSAAGGACTADADADVVAQGVGAGLAAAPELAPNPVQTAALQR